MVGTQCEGGETEGRWPGPQLEVWHLLVPQAGVQGPSQKSQRSSYPELTPDLTGPQLHPIMHVSLPQIWVQIPSASSMMLSKLLSVFGPPFFHMENGDSNACFIRLL